MNNETTRTQLRLKRILDDFCSVSNTTVQTIYPTGKALHYILKLSSGKLELFAILMSYVQKSTRNQILCSIARAYQDAQMRQWRRQLNIEEGECL